jgi:hypothetical protein
MVSILPKEPKGEGMRGITGVLSGAAFVFGTLMLFWMMSLAFSGDEAIIAQIEMGVMACALFLAAIYLKPGPEHKRDDY